MRDELTTAAETSVTGRGAGAPGGQAHSRRSIRCSAPDGAEKGTGMRRNLVWTFVALLMMLPVVGVAQMRGLGRIGGTVIDAGGGPIAAVNVSATLAGSSGAIESKSDEKGVWAVVGMSKGEWHVTFQKAGYEPKAAKVILDAELARVSPIAVALKKF